MDARFLPHALVATLLFAMSSAAVGQGGAATADVGKEIFRHGKLGSGEQLEASREGGLRMRGDAAACVNCHRRSGLGSRAGLTTIPPITGRYLLHPRAKDGQDLDLPYVEGIRADREPYTDATIARAIREGLDSEGKPLSYLMPHFAIDDADMAALIDYLKHLDVRRVPGVTDTVLHFATIVTPDADPVKRRGMLSVLEQYFADKNEFPLGPTPRLKASRSMMFMVNRRWQLHVWELSGPESTWLAQLRYLSATEPVFAVISGLGGRNWAPVHDFCEQEAVPCIFPNVEVPVDSGRDFYALYFSDGVALEAELMAKRILDGLGDKALPKGRAPVVTQVYRRDDSGERGAKALAEALGRRGVAVSMQALAPGDTVAKAVRAGASASAMVFWLRPTDIAALGKIAPPAVPVFMSGLLAGLERAPLSPRWRAVTRLAYPFDLPERRRVRVDYALGWFAIRRIPIVAEQVQADTFLACGLLAETLAHMSGTFVRDYLVERLEDMVERRIITGYYPRLTLAPGQRFASKGGYIVRFADPAGTKLAPEGDWIVP